MGYLSQVELEAMGFKKLGQDVKISDRASIYNPELIQIGDHSRIDDFCVVSGKIVMGRNVHIAALCLVAGGTEGIYFGDFSGLAYGVFVFTQNDDYEGRALHNPTVPEKYRMVNRASVYIGQNALIGTHCVITPGVVIAGNSSVGANSLVTRSTESGWLYYGVPAKPIRPREWGLLEQRERYINDCG